MKKRIFALTLAFLLIATCFAGCAAKEYSVDVAESDSYYESYNYKEDSYYDTAEVSDDYYSEEAEEISDSGSLSDMTIDSALQSSRKIILTADISMETEDFSASVEALREAVESLGGYISNAENYVYNSVYSLHNGSYTVRIPTENFSAFISKSETMGNVRNSNVWQSDVTNRYTDIETRLATLETKRDRLLELMEQATEMYDIIELENALTDTVYEIERLTGEKKGYDDRIAYSTANVHINEVRTVTEPVVMPRTFGERINQAFHNAIDGFKEGFEDFTVWLIEALPTILIIAIIVFLVIFIIRRTAPRRAAKREYRKERKRVAAEEYREKRNAALKAAEEKKPEEKKEEDK